MSDRLILPGGKNIVNFSTLNYNKNGFSGRNNFYELKHRRSLFSTF